MGGLIRRLTHHLATAVLVAAALSTPLRAGELIYEQVGSPTAPGQPSSDFVSSWESWDIEVADDFDIVGVVREVWALGFSGPFPPTGAWVRFYKVAEGGGPGDLVREHFFASSDPLLLANHSIIHAVLPEPLEVEGGLFVSVQQKLNSSGSNPTVASYWTWNGTLNGYPNGEPSYTRNPAGGWTDVCATWCETGADRIFRLYGELLEPPPPPPPPAVLTITPQSVARSGRFIITGSNFSDSEDEHQLLLNGAPAPHAAWSDGEIHGYVPGDTPLGSATVQIVTAGGVTASQTIEILPLEPGDGRVRWRFQADGINLYQRAGVAGTARCAPTGPIFAELEKRPAWPLRVQAGRLAVSRSARCGAP